MPAVSKKQGKFMRAVAHSPSFAKKVGVPMSVGREFTKSGGGMPVKPMSESKMRSQESDTAKRSAVGGMKKGGMAMVMKNGKKIPAFAAKKGDMAMKKMASGGLAGGHKAADGIASKGKTKAKQVMMKSGGKTC